MTSKMLAAAVLGAFIGIASPAIGLSAETPATLQVQQEDPGLLNKLKSIGGKVIESGKEKWTQFQDPDVEVRTLRYQNEELKRRIFLLERQQSDKQVMHALDYNQAMMCLENIGSLLHNYKPSILNPVPPPQATVLPEKSTNQPSEVSGNVE